MLCVMILCLKTYTYVTYCINKSLIYTIQFGLIIRPNKCI